MESAICQLKSEAIPADVDSLRGPFPWSVDFVRDVLMNEGVQSEQLRVRPILFKVHLHRSVRHAREAVGDVNERGRDRVAARQGLLLDWE